MAVPMIPTLARAYWTLAAFGLVYVFAMLALTNVTLQRQYAGNLSFSAGPYTDDL